MISTHPIISHFLIIFYEFLESDLDSDEEKALKLQKKQQQAAAVTMAREAAGKKTKA
jgi:hypothetical protein